MPRSSALSLSFTLEDFEQLPLARTSPPLATAAAGAIAAIAAAARQVGRWDVRMVFLNSFGTWCEASCAPAGRSRNGTLVAARLRPRGARDKIRRVPVDRSRQRDAAP